MLTGSLSTPIGVVCLGVTASGLARVRFPRRDGSASPVADTPERHRDEAKAHLDAARVQIAAYFAGELKAFDLVIDWTGVEGLRLDVLQLIASVPFGRVTTYGELARDIGQPGAAQAIGQVMGSNPVPIVVPCHRVLAADGLGGFGGGVRTKEWLLAHEGALSMTFDFA